MINPNYKVMGIGVVHAENSTYKYYWTVDFGVAVDSTAHWVDGSEPTTTTPTTSSPPTTPSWCRTSPVAAADVAAVVATLLAEPQSHHQRIYELTGPDLLDIDGLAQSFARGLHQQVTGVDVAHDEWVEHTLARAGLAPHVHQHIATMARLHRAGRYSRLTDDVEAVTGRPAVSVERYIATHPQKFGAAPRS